jgi:hypothetical protein
MSLQEIVNVAITRETKAVSQVGFNTLLILGPNGNFSTRTQAFTEVDATMAAALVGGSASAEYKAAQDAMAQNPRPSTIKIGQVKGTRVFTDNAGTYTAGTASITINGTVVTAAYNADKDTTLTALAAAIAAHAAVDTAVYSSGGHTITITANTGYLLSLSAITGVTGTCTFTLSATATEDYDDALDAIVLYDDNWYGLVSTTRTQNTQVAIAAWVETKKKVYVAADSTAAIVDSTDVADTTSLAAVLKAAAYARTTVVFSALAATEYPDAALLGKIMPFDPGTYTVKFKTLASITADTLTATQSTNARDKHVNVNEEIGGGVNIIREGTVAEGEFIDTIIFIDWLDARITEEVYSVLVNNQKVPFTRIGMAAIKGAIEKVLKIGQNVGGISEYSQDTSKVQNGGYVVTLPDFDTLSTVDKANRLLRGVEFTAWLAGAIHAVTIDGIVSL